MTVSLAEFIVKYCRPEHAVQLLQFTPFDNLLNEIVQADVNKSLIYYTSPLTNLSRFYLNTLLKEDLAGIHPKIV